MRSAFAFACLALVAVAPAFAQDSKTDWPSFGGPTHDWISAETGWKPWTAAPKTLWKASVGKGYSAVSVADGKAYTLGNENDTDTVWCFDATTGKEVWKQSYPCPAEKQYPGPRSTPTVDGKFVYTLSRMGNLCCFDTSAGGKPVWNKSAKDFGCEPPKSGWGFACSPVVVDKWVIADFGTVVAFDKATGAVVWKAELGKVGFSTPKVFGTGADRGLAVFNAAGLSILNLADGKVLGSFPWKTQYEINAAEPVVFEDKGKTLAFISSGYGSGCALLDISKGAPTVVWQNKNMKNHFATSVLYKDYLYGIDGQVSKKAPLICMSVADGTVKWKQDGIGSGGVMEADGKLIVLGEGGDLKIVDAASDKYTELATAELGKGTWWNMPVLSGAKIFCRSLEGDLVCVDVSGK